MKPGLEQERSSSIKRWYSQIKRSFAVSKKNIKIYYNKGPVIIQGFLIPTMLFLAFTIGRQVKPMYVISGLLAMVLFFTAASIGPVVFPWETRQKTLERLITCPISIKTILLGDIWGSFVFGLIFSIFPLFLGILLFSLWATVNWVILILAIIVASFSFASFSIILSIPPTDNPGNIMIFTLSVKFPLIFLSALFQPVESAPYSVISPITYFIDIINYGFSGQSAFGPFGVVLDFFVLLLFGFGSLFLAFWAHEKILQKRFT